MEVATGSIVVVNQASESNDTRVETRLDPEAFINLINNNQATLPNNAENGGARQYLGIIAKKISKLKDAFPALNFEFIQDTGNTDLWHAKTSGEHKICLRSIVSWTFSINLDFTNDSIDLKDHSFGEQNKQKITPEDPLGQMELRSALSNAGINGSIKLESENADASPKIYSLSSPTLQNVRIAII